MLVRVKPLCATQVAPGGDGLRVHLRERQSDERQQQQRQQATADAMHLETSASDACNKGLSYLYCAIQRAEEAQTMASGADAKVGTAGIAWFSSCGRGRYRQGVKTQRCRNRFDMMPPSVSEMIALGSLLFSDIWFCSCHRTMPSKAQ